MHWRQQRWDQVLKNQTSGSFSKQHWFCSSRLPESHCPLRDKWQQLGGCTPKSNTWGDKRKGKKIREKSTASLGSSEDFSVKKAQCPTWERGSLAVTLGWSSLGAGAGQPRLKFGNGSEPSKCPMPAQPRAASKNKPREYRLWPFQWRGEFNPQTEKTELNSFWNQ